MSLIEQAAKRLAELRRAGATLSEGTPPESATGDAADLRQDQLSTPEKVVRELAKTRSRPLVSAVEGVPLHDRIAVDSHQHAEPLAPRNKVAIDLTSLMEKGFVTPDAPQSAIAHEFRVIKRPIIHNAQGRSGSHIRNGALVMVTSALPGEGKTFTAANLAISLAMEFDHTVLLVDGDASHPSLPSVLGVPHSAGLLDLLTRDDLHINDVLLQTNLEKLLFLPAGSRHRFATELLASERMQSLLQELASSDPDRIIIFDSPPLLATTEARVLATQMGQIVMVVAADATSRKAVNHALSLIEDCEVVLMLLNKTVGSSNSSYYGYYADDAPAS